MAMPIIVGNKLERKDAPSTYAAAPPPSLGSDGKVKRDGPEPYPTAGAPPLGSRDKLKRQDEPETYPEAPAPPLGDKLKREPDEPSTYAAAPPPSLGGDKVKRQYPTYAPAPPPTLGGDKIKRQYPTYAPAPAPTLGGDKIKRQSTYAAAPAPSLGGDKIKRQSSYAPAPAPTLGGDGKVKRQYPTYGNAPPPTLGGDKIRRQYPTYAPAPAPAPSLGGKVKRQSGNPPSYGNAPPPPLGGKVKRQPESPPSYGNAPPPSLGGKVKRQPESPPSYGNAPPPSLGGKIKREHNDPPVYTIAPAPPLGDADKAKRQDTSSQISATATPTATSTINQATTTTTKSPYTQLAGTIESPKGKSFPADVITAANYYELCPGGDCLTACQNMTRVFQGIPDGINAGQNYGQIPANGSLPEVTLFGICSNLGYVSTLAQTNYSNTDFATFFPPAGLQGALHNVSNDISLCLVDTCQYTRDPSQCVDSCSLNTLQTSNTTISVTAGVYPCLYQLCRNTCGLPYANQDVYGVGVLASYITQAILVLILAVGLIFFASWRYFKQRSDKEFTIPKRMKESMELFLATECYFGISAAIASYLLRPATVDPLNGYALLSVAITGFIPPTFTLMLLHSHGVKSWYTSLLTFTSWLFSTVLFFMLLRNLTNTIDNPRAMDEGLNSLFHVESCGHSSAMSLCKQTFGTDPISYLSYFYNYHNIPGIKTVPILWVLSTVVLLGLTVVQGYEHLRKHTQNRPIDPEDTQSHRRRNFNATLSLAGLWIGCILFGLALGYQARMVIAFTLMDVINWHGWTFGQVVALLFWAPALINCFRSYVLEPKQQMRNNTMYGPKYSDFTDEKARVAVSSDQLSSLTPMSQKQFFSPSDASIYRQESEWSEQGVKVPVNMLLGGFGQSGRSGRDDGGSEWADTSKRDSIIR